MVYNYNMRKNLKYSATFTIIILSSMLGYVAYAEEVAGNVATNPVACTMDAKTCSDGSSVSRVAPDCKFALCPGEVANTEKNRNRNQVKREEVRKEIDAIKNELSAKKETYKEEMSALLQSIKTKRQGFKAEFETAKTEAGIKITAARTSFLASLKNVRDENKKTSAEKIVSTLQALNMKFTDQFSNKIDQIENILVSIESRIKKAEDKGLDVTTVKTQVEKAKQSIADARTAISTQTQKIYSVDVTNDTTLKTQMKTLRNDFSSDIKNVYTTVKSAHMAVKTTATTLAQIPKIDETDTTTTETNNNTNN